MHEGALSRNIIPTKGNSPVAGHHGRVRRVQIAFVPAAAEREAI
jgi:hypothetical protein